MNLELTDDQEFFRSTTRKFLEAETPLAAVRALYESPIGYEPDWWERGAALGWTSMLVPEPFGGGSLSGRPVADLAIVAEEIGRLVSPGPLVPVNIVLHALTAGAPGGLSDDVAGVVEKLLSGSASASWALMEPEGHWGVTKPATTLTVSGDEIRLTGRKVNVEAAASAEHFLVTAAHGDGLAQVLVPAAAGGVTVTPGRSIDMTRRFGSVRFEDVRLPSTHLVGDTGVTRAAVDRQLAIALCLQCAEMCGIADRVMEMTLDYGRDRFAFGRPIVSFQAIKHRVADMTVKLEGSKAITDALADSLDASAEDALRLASVAKAYVGETCLDVVDECVQITGGIGVTWEHDIHLYNRRAAVDRALYGTPEEHKDRLLHHMLEDEGVSL